MHKPQPTEYPQVLALVRRVFDATVGTHYSQEGRDEFYKYIEPNAFALRQKADHFTLVAKDGDEIVGVIEVRNYNHVALLFVDMAHQHQGIGKKLLADALTICREHNPALKEISVHSSPNSCEIYQKMGFAPQDAEKEVHEIRFTTMKLFI